MRTAALLARLIDKRQEEVAQQVRVAPPPPAARLTASALAALIDHTLLKPEAQEAAIRQLCAEAQRYGFASVCVNAGWAARCAALIEGSGVKVCAVVGFPLGATLPAVKAFEAAAAIRAGAAEVDMVINIGQLKDGDYFGVYTDIAEVVTAAKPAALVKVIIETALLRDPEKVAACVLAQEAGADFVKTSTGFGGGGATVADVHLMRLVVGPGLGVKASGGVRSALDALALVGAGATRLGASAGVRIVEELTAGALDGEPGAKEAY
jgi:deoxyribose-phosphate aldolase